MPRWFRLSFRGVWWKNMSAIKSDDKGKRREISLIFSTYKYISKISLKIHFIPVFCRECWNWILNEADGRCMDFYVFLPSPFMTQKCSPQHIGGMENIKIKENFSVFERKKKMCLKHSNLNDKLDTAMDTILCFDFLYSPSKYWMFTISLHWYYSIARDWHNILIDYAWKRMILTYINIQSFPTTWEISYLYGKPIVNIVLETSR